MARQHRSDYYTFSRELLGVPIPADMFNMNNNAAMTMPFMCSDDVNSPVSVASFPDQQFGVPDCIALSEWEMGFPDLAGCSYKKQVFEECSGSMAAPNYLCPPYDHHMAADNWGIQGKEVAKMEEPEVKVGRYSVEERKNRILRYVKKRNQRNFNKTIKYACRKTLADKRVRVRGRFAKNNDNENTMNTSYHSFQQNMSFYDDSVQMMICNDDDDWLQAGMDGLMYLPYISG